MEIHIKHEICIKRGCVIKHCVHDQEAMKRCKVATRLLQQLYFVRNFSTAELKYKRKQLANTGISWNGSPTVVYMPVLGRYLHQGGYVFITICLSVCQQLSAKTSKPICMKFSGTVDNGPMNNWLNFGGDLDHCLDTGSVFQIGYYWEIGKAW